MVTDKQINKTKTKQKRENKRGIIGGAKVPQQIYVGLGPKQERLLQKIFFREQKLRQVFDFDFLAKPFFKSLLAPSSWDRVDDPQLAEVVLKPTYCWSCYVADVRERAADQITK